MPFNFHTQPTKNPLKSMQDFGVDKTHGRIIWKQIYVDILENNQNSQVRKDPCPLSNPKMFTVFRSATHTNTNLVYSDKFLSALPSSYENIGVGFLEICFIHLG